MCKSNPICLIQQWSGVISLVCCVQWRYLLVCHRKLDPFTFSDQCAHSACVSLCVQIHEMNENILVLRFKQVCLRTISYADPDKDYNTKSKQCVLLCFMKLILGNRYVRSRGFIVSKPRETHTRSEIADVPTLPCPPLDNLGCPDPHPPP